MALPGGKSEECDKDDIETAVREAKEEIGLEPALVCIVAILEPFMTKVKLPRYIDYLNFTNSIFVL